MAGEWAKERGKDVTTTKTTKNIKNLKILYSDGNNRFSHKL